MTDPTPAPDPKPDVPMWQKGLQVLLLIITGLLAGPHVIPNPTPNPTPAPSPQPNPQPAPDPTPKPNPQPSPTPNIITITDPKGNVINGTVDVGALFIVSAPQGISLLGLPQPTADSGSVIVVSPDKLVCSLKAGGKLEIIGYGSGVPTVMMIQTNPAPQPPPNPSPTPNPQPNPNPTPVTNKRLGVAFIEVAGSRSDKVASMLAASGKYAPMHDAGIPTIWYDVSDPSPIAKMAVNALNNAGVKVASDNAGYVVYDMDSKTPLYADKAISIDDVTSHVGALLGKVLR